LFFDRRLTTTKTKGVSENKKEKTKTQSEVFRCKNTENLDSLVDPHRPTLRITDFTNLTRGRTAGGCRAARYNHNPVSFFLMKNDYRQIHQVW